MSFGIFASFLLFFLHFVAELSCLCKYIACFVFVILGVICIFEFRFAAFQNKFITTDPKRLPIGGLRCTIPLAWLRRNRCNFVVIDCRATERCDIGSLLFFTFMSKESVERKLHEQHQTSQIAGAITTITAKKRPFTRSDGLFWSKNFNLTSYPYKAIVSLHALDICNFRILSGCVWQAIPYPVVDWLRTLSAICPEHPSEQVRSWQTSS